MPGLAGKSVILLDISRVIWRARRRGPTGIDRVELAYARHFIAGQSERPAYAVLHLCGFLFAISPAAGRRFVDELSARWEGLARRRGIIQLYFHLFCSVWLAGPWLRRALRRHPGSPVFLVVSHHHVADEYAIARLRRTLRVRTACFIHDLIPIEYPEYFKSGWEERYHRLSGNIGKLFDAVIANSESTANSVRKAVQGSPENHPTRPMIRTAVPGVRFFPQSTLVRPVEQDCPYFAVLGTIEPRKNHLLLLNLWSRLATLPTPPRLLVIGARGWENEQVLDMLERSRRLRGLVKEYNGLADAEVGALLRNARALLLPSFAEGFGLPLAEALASGIPVICSNIPVFREVGRHVPEYLDPLNLQEWRDAILDYSCPNSVLRAAQMERLSQWHPPSWDDHFEVVEGLLADLDVGRKVVASVQTIWPIKYLKHSARPRRKSQRQSSRM